MEGKIKFYDHLMEGSRDKENWGWMFRKMDGYIVRANYAITYLRIVLEVRD